MKSTILIVAILQVSSMFDHAESACLYNAAPVPVSAVPCAPASNILNLLEYAASIAAPTNVLCPSPILSPPIISPITCSAPISPPPLITAPVSPVINAVPVISPPLIDIVPCSSPLVSPCLVDPFPCNSPPIIVDPIPPCASPVVIEPFGCTAVDPFPCAAPAAFKCDCNYSKRIPPPFI